MAAVSRHVISSVGRLSFDMNIAKNTKLKFGSTPFMAVLFVLLSFSFCFAQKPDENNSPVPLKLELRIDQKKLCIGKTFEVVARLTNISSKNVTIDDRLVWRYVTEKASDRSSVTGTSEFAKLLKVPQFRMSMGDNFPDEELPKEYLKTLKPNEFYEDTQKIRADDNFFRTAGRYSIKSGYGQFADWSKERVDLFKGSVDSNELEFKLCEC